MAKFAVVKLKNAQYKVTEGNVIEVPKIEGKAGDKLTIDEILLKVNDSKVEIGKPTIAKAKVTAEIVEQIKGEKVVSSTYKAKSRTRRKVGHRSLLTRIKINKIT
ncbi:MAG: 50S ribosomal protein L21 [Candidatus Dojkabacteria bacterium]